MTDPPRADVLDRTLLALADPTRRAILRRLADGTARVTDVAAPFPISLAAVSKHIRVLERAGIVRRTVNGREHVLRLDLESLAPATEWIAGLREFWERRLDRLEQLLVARTRRGPAGGRRPHAPRVARGRARR